jgi:hypothetical protein
MFIRAVLFLVISSACCHAYTRNVVKTLRVYNGGRWGDWNLAQYCPHGQYATGYRLKVYKATMQYCESNISRGVIIFVELVVN